MSSNSPPRRVTDAAPSRPVVRRPVVIPRRMPMRQARRVSLFEREIRVRLSPAAIEILFTTAAVMSEGLVDDNLYYGSTMITIDLSRVDGHITEACDVSTARDVERLLADDPRVHERARRVCATEASRLAGQAIQPPQIDLRVHRSGRHFHIDMDVEAITEGVS
jgi:hypothetical protein